MFEYAINYNKKIKSLVEVNPTSFTKTCIMFN